MTVNKSGRVALGICFLTAASRYWLDIFPRICCETRRWRKHAETIPDPELRRLALEAQQLKRGNIEGSAALAAFVPRRWRKTVVRAQVAFQAAYDYVDTLAEQPNETPLRNAKQLHQVLLVALDRDAAHPDYYAHYPHQGDAGYLQEIANTCRSAIRALPSYPAIEASARKVAERIAGYQSLNLTEAQGGHEQLELWALTETPPCTGLRWWETAASTGSSLALFALIAAAAQPALAPAEAVAIEAAYWPWIGALHSLLDSLIDEAQDQAAEQRSLLSYYLTPQQTVSRFQILAREARHAAESLPKAHEHTLILAGMASYYLSAPEASSPEARCVSAIVIETLEPIIAPTMRVLAARRTASRLMHLKRSRRR
jgi:tetraprenyl-beta-curcumene synthase